MNINNKCTCFHVIQYEAKIRKKYYWNNKKTDDDTELKRRSDAKFGK